MDRSDDRKRLAPYVPVPAQEGGVAVGPGLAPAGNRRAGSRLETHHNASVKLSNVSYTVGLRDVSRTGARIEIRRGLVPAVGQVVQLQFLNDMTAEATVVWTDGTLAGLSFVEALPDGFDAVHFDDLGSDYYRAVLKLQIGSR